MLQLREQLPDLVRLLGGLGIATWLSLLPLG